MRSNNQAFDAPSREFSMGRARSILKGLRGAA